MAINSISPSFQGIIIVPTNSTARKIIDQQPLAMRFLHSKHAAYFHGNDPESTKIETAIVEALNKAGEKFIHLVGFSSKSREAKKAIAAIETFNLFA